MRIHSSSPFILRLFSRITMRSGVLFSISTIACTPSTAPATRKPECCKRNANSLFIVELEETSRILFTNSSLLRHDREVSIHPVSVRLFLVTNICFVVPVPASGRLPEIASGLTPFAMTYIRSSGEELDFYLLGVATLMM